VHVAATGRNFIWEGFRVIFHSIDKPENAKELISGAVIPPLEQIATFFTTVSALSWHSSLATISARQAQRRAGD
jgi:hypothetical protein